MLFNAFTLLKGIQLSKKTDPAYTYVTSVSQTCMLLWCKQILITLTIAFYTKFRIFMNLVTYCGVVFNIWLWVISSVD